MTYAGMSTRAVSGGWLHRLAHWLGMNHCAPISWNDANGDHYCGAQCVTCGAVHPDTVVNFGARHRRAATEKPR
jgi:hypothetical protein